MPGCLFACKGLFFLREPCYNLNDPQGNGKTKPIFALFNVSPRKGTEAFPCSIINGDITTEPTHTPQGDVNENRLSKRESSSEPTHTPQGDVNMGTIKNATGGDEPTHTPQGDVKFSQNNSKCRSELEPTHTPQGDGSKQVPESYPSKQLLNQLTPRKGTEKNIDRIVFEVFCDLTHPPQGDGSPSR